MDSDTIVFEVGHSFGSDDDIRSAEVEHRRPLRIEDPEHIEDLVALYEDLEVVKLNAAWFRAQLLAINADFEQVEEAGLLFLTDIIPEFTANFHAVFWDRTLSAARREMMKEFIHDKMEAYGLVRVQATVPELNQPYIKHLKKTGFIEEGILRKAWREPQGDFNVHIFSILKGEV